MKRKTLVDELKENRPEFTVDLNETVPNRNQKIILEFVIRTQGKLLIGDDKSVTVYIQIKDEESRVVGIQREE